MRLSGATNEDLESELHPVTVCGHEFGLLRNKGRSWDRACDEKHEETGEENLRKRAIGGGSGRYGGSFKVSIQPSSGTLCPMPSGVVGTLTTVRAAEAMLPAMS